LALEVQRGGIPGAPGAVSLGAVVFGDDLLSV